jgi:hypothetical protein
MTVVFPAFRSYSPLNPISMRKKPLSDTFRIVLIAWLIWGTALEAFVTNSLVLVPPDYLSFIAPSVGSSYVDPVFGTTFTRVSDAAQTSSADDGQPLSFVAAEYSTKSPFNSDNSKLLLIEFSYFALYDAVTRQRVKPFCCSFPIVAASSEPLWSRTDPNLFYFHPAGSNQLMTYNVATNVVKLVRTFSEYSSISAKGESEMSYDGDHIVLSGDGDQIFVYTISTDTKGPVFETSGKNPFGWDAVYITPDNNVLIAWHTNGASRYQGEELYDQNMNFLRQVSSSNGHKHVTRDVDGSEVLVKINSADPIPNPNCENALVKIKLATAQQTCLLQLDFSLSAHVSAPDHGGWMFAETNNHSRVSSPWFPYTNELLQIKLDGTEVRRLGHHRSDSRTYDGQPRIASSRDGSRFVYNSNMMGAIPDVYMAAASTGSVAPPMILTSLSPMSGGGDAFTLTVTGTNFYPGAVVVWNGTTRPTTFVSNTQLTAAISSLDLAIAGTAQVSAFGPILGGGTSTALPFAITKKRRGQLLSN